MKRCILILGVLLLAGSAWAARTMSVQVREGQLRSRASFLGSVVGQVAYGEKVSVEETQAGWSRITTESGASGWIHESALTRKTLVAGSGASDARIGASGEEVALAGKGFSKEVEAEYKKQNRELDYTWVDWMGKLVVPESRMREFLVQGDLTH